MAKNIQNSPHPQSLPQQPGKYNSKSKLIRIYQTPRKVRFHIRSRLKLGAEEHWIIVFRKVDGEVIQVVKPEAMDFTLDKFDFAFAELYLVSPGELCGVYRFRNLFQRNFPILKK